MNRARCVALKFSMRASHWRAWLLWHGLAATLVTPAAAQEFQYVDKARVAESTRLDWVYPLLGRSPAAPPNSLLSDYNSRSQTYEFFGPHAPNDSATYPLVIFVSPSNRPLGWTFWESTCRRRRVLFAGLHDAGNGVAEARRVRAVLDVLDDVRRRFRVDADRTYLAGFSGGAHVACRVAFHLPEYFGGVVAVGHAPQLPSEPWLLHRMRDRLSVALACGDRDPAVAWVEELAEPMLVGAGVRTATSIVPGMRHTMPHAAEFEATWEWLEAGLSGRREQARRFPASRLGEAPSRKEWAERLNAEARDRLQDPMQVDGGLRQLEWISQRWPDLPEAKAATTTLAEYAAHADRPWQRQRDDEVRRLMRLQAAGVGSLALRGGPSQGELARQAVALWEALLQDNSDRHDFDVANSQLPALRALAERAENEAKPTPLNRVRFNLTGEVTLREGLGHLERALAALGYKLSVDESALRAAGVDFERKFSLKLPAGRLEDVNRTFFRPAGLRMVRTKNVIAVVPRATPPPADPQGDAPSVRHAAANE